MMNAPTYSDAQSWPDHTMPYPFNPESNTNAYPQAQPSGSGWLFGDLVTGQAPPPSWTGLAGRPHVEEYVPPNTPQPMGVTDDRLLVWPKRASQSRVGNSPAQVKDDTSDLMQLPFFRQQVLKRQNKEIKEGRLKLKPFSELVAYNEAIARNFEERTGGCADVNWGPGMTTQSYASSNCSPTQYPSWHVPGAEHQIKDHGQREHHPSYAARVHVQNMYSDRVITATYHRSLPQSITTYLPKLIQPTNPSQLQFTLRAMNPVSVYTRYSCEAGCRSRGICVHFTFILGGRSAPDGLVCDRCTREGVEKAVNAKRACPRHADGCVYLAEDILATDVQMARAREILGRAIGCEWEGIPGRMGADEGVAMGATTESGPWSSLLTNQNGHEQGIDQGGSFVKYSTEDRVSDGEPSAKRLRLDDQDAVSNLNNSAVEEQKSFIHDLPSLDGEFSYDSDLYSDFSQFANGSNDWLSNSDVRTAVE